MSDILTPIQVLQNEDRCTAAEDAVLLDRHIYQGDNIKRLKELPNDSIDLIYIDPPFNTGETYEIVWNEPDERVAFEDRFGDVKHYIDWLRPRAAELARVLKPNGTMFVHCDPHVNYAIRVLLQDEIKLCFRSEIVWKRSSSHGGAKRPAAIHDTIFFFAKGRQHTWNKLLQPLSQETLKTWYRNVEPGTGRLFNRERLTAPGTRKKESGKPWRNIDPNLRRRHWAIPRWEPVASIVKGKSTQAALDALDAAKRLHWPKKPGGIPTLKRYIEEAAGVPLQDVWDDISRLQNSEKERVGFPTQKPVALMKRIIQMASNDGDLVLDAFCGCGSTLVAAANLKRKWIGIDISPTACRVVGWRLTRETNLKEGRDFWIRTLEVDERELREMKPFDFQSWAVSALGGVPNLRKVCDGGIDGRLYVVDKDDIPKAVQKVFSFGVTAGTQHELSFEGDPIPLQVKQKDKVGRPDIDAFETAMQREKRRIGIFVAFSYTSGAMEEVKRAEREQGIKILPITVREILESKAA